MLSTSVEDIENKESVLSQQSNIIPNENSYTFSPRSPTKSNVTDTFFETCASNLSLSPPSSKSHPFSSQTLSEIKNETKAGLRVKYHEHPGQNTGTKSLAKEKIVTAADFKGFDITYMFPNDTLKKPEVLNFDKENKFDNVADNSNADLLEFLSDDSENGDDGDLNNLGFQAVELSSEPDFEATSILRPDDELDSSKAHKNESVGASSLKLWEQKELNNSCLENIVPEVMEQLGTIASEDIPNQIVKVLSAENKQMVTNKKSYNWYDRARGKSSIFPSSNLEDYRNGIQFGKKTNSMKLIEHNIIEVGHSQELVKYNNLEAQRKQNISESEFESQTETESEMIKPKRNRQSKREHKIEDDNYTDLLIEKFANKQKSKNLKRIRESKLVSDLEELDVYKPKKRVTLKKLMKDGRRTRYNYKIHVNPDTLPSFITQFMKPPDV